MPGIMVAHMSLWVYSSSLICGGRQQRFWSALTLAVTTGTLITIVVMLFAMLTQILEGIMPQLTVRGREFVFDALNMEFSPVPLLMIPLTFTISLVFHKKPMLAMLFAIILFQILFAMSIVSKLTIMNWRVQIGLVHIIIMLLCSWAIFIVVLRRISMRCCIVR